MTQKTTKKAPQVQQAPQEQQEVTKDVFTSENIERAVEIIAKKLVESINYNPTDDFSNAFEWALDCHFRFGNNKPLKTLLFKKWGKRGKMTTFYNHFKIAKYLEDIEGAIVYNVNTEKLKIFGTREDFISYSDWYLNKLKQAKEASESMTKQEKLQKKLNLASYTLEDLNIIKTMVSQAIKDKTTVNK